MRTSTAIVACVMCASMLAGCLAGPQADGGRGEPTDGAPANLSAGCNASRPAVAYGPGGDVVDEPRADRPVPCSSRTGAVTAEPTIGVTSDGTVFFYPAGMGGTDPDDNVGLARLDERGGNWTIVHPGIEGRPTHTDTLDPFLVHDEESDRIFLDDLATPNCSLLSWTDDKGASWDRSVAGCLGTDHQKLLVGPPSLGPTVGYPSVVYRCTYNAGLAEYSVATTCQRSRDGGRTWLGPGEPPFVTEPTNTDSHGRVPGWCDGGLGEGTVGPDGRVYLAKTWCAQPTVAVSDDEGLTWDRVQVASNGAARRADGMVDNDAGVAVDDEGNVYFTWVAEDRNLYLATSTDHGRSWSEPIDITPPGVVESNMAYAAAGSKGRVVVASMGAPNAPGPPYPDVDCTETPEPCVNGTERPGYGNVTWNGYLTVAVDALSEDPKLYSAPVNDPSDPLIVGHCGPGRCQEVLDFIDAAVGPDGTPWGAFADGCVEGSCQPDDDGDGWGVAGWMEGGPSLVVGD